MKLFVVCVVCCVLLSQLVADKLNIKGHWCGVKAADVNAPADSSRQFLHAPCDIEGFRCIFYTVLFEYFFEFGFFEK